MHLMVLVFSVSAVVVKAQDILFPDDYESYRREKSIAQNRPFELKEFLKSNELFSADLYKELNKVNTDNFLVCPYSLQIILALVHAAARDQTSKEIANALHFPDDSNKIQNIIKTLPLDTSNLYTLTSANKIYLANHFRINDNFKRIAQDIFEADIESIDLTRNQEAASNINGWVEKKTNNTIKNLIDKQYLEPDTVFVMVNALYFNADWLNPFDSFLTTTLGFYLNKTEVVNVEMMVTIQDCNWYHNKHLDAVFLELPYKGEEVSMIIVLPNKLDGLSKLEDNISGVLEQQPLVESETEVPVWLPKFKMETSIPLKKIMKNLGIKEAFSYKAKFEGMTVGNQSIFINHAIQKTFIQVTEKGTTAGAATAVVNGDRSIGDRFIANHPFIYILRHKKNGILFVGKLTNPLLTGSE